VLTTSRARFPRILSIRAPTERCSMMPVRATYGEDSAASSRCRETGTISWGFAQFQAAATAWRHVFNPAV
jgi:hypothetical protein